MRNLLRHMPLVCLLVSFLAVNAQSRNPYDLELENLRSQWSSAAKLEKLAKINQYHVSLFAYYLDKLRSTPDGEGNLLDHSLVMLGSGMGNPDVHDHIDLPVAVAGGAAGRMKGARHIKYEKPVPLANVHLSLLDRAGVHLDSFADSNGKIVDLAAPAAL